MVVRQARDPMWSCRRPTPSRHDIAGRRRRQLAAPVVRPRRISCVDGPSNPTAPHYGPQSWVLAGTDIPTAQLQLLFDPDPALVPAPAVLVNCGIPPPADPSYAAPRTPKPRPLSPL